MILFHRAKSNIADITLRDSVERQLDWEPQITSTEVGVAAENGVVTLTGFVGTYAEKLEAERAALRTYGVCAVANDIQVKPLFRKIDADVAAAALAALQERVDVPDRQIKFTVKDGWITLQGDVDWYYQKSAAQLAVKYLSGVKGVTDEIRVKPHGTIVEVKDKIEDALKRSAEVDARRIEVQATNGKVTLKGSVRSWFEKNEAETAAWAAPGVTEVCNQIAVVP